MDSIAYSFDDASQPLGESHSGTLLNGLGVSVTMNNALQRQNLSLTGVTGYSVGYGYDSAGRLQTVTSGNSTVTYSYVANSMLVGQVSSVQAGMSMTTTKNYDLLNRLTSISSVVSGSASLTLPISFGYSYNQADQRTRATLAGGSYWIYSYDPLGQVTSGKRYWADGTPVAGQQFEYGFDNIGNRKSTGVGGDASGAGMRGATYNFGEVLRATGPMAKANPFRFSTKYQDDETDLLYYGHRYYNASMGSWLSRDPIEEDGGLNIYVFVQNETVSRVDADGRCSCVITLHCVRGTVLTWIDATTVIGPVTITRGRDIANYDCTITRQSGCCPLSLVGLPGGTQRRQVRWVQIFPPGKRVGSNLLPAYDINKCLYLPIPDGA